MERASTGRGQQFRARQCSSRPLGHDWVLAAVCMAQALATAPGKAASTGRRGASRRGAAAYGGARVSRR